MLEVQTGIHYTDSMKNKNNVTNRTVSELVDLICELQTKKGNGDFKHSYALGTVQAILDWHVKGYTTDLQETINDSYNNVKTEMDYLVIEPTVYERQVIKAKEALATIGA